LAIPGIFVGLANLFDPDEFGSFITVFGEGHPQSLSTREKVLYSPIYAALGYLMYFIMFFLGLPLLLIFIAIGFGLFSMVKGLSEISIGGISIGDVVDNAKKGLSEKDEFFRRIPDSFEVEIYGKSNVADFWHANSIHSGSPCYISRCKLDFVEGEKVTIEKSGSFGKCFYVRDSNRDGASASFEPKSYSDFEP
jgi:hypothetical protein